MHNNVRNRLAWTVACMLALPVAPVLAQPSPAPSPSPASDDRPWAKGVSEHEQDLALELYTAGNQEFAESRFAQALAKYREAIRHWDHPAIRYNIALCLINLGQPVEAKGNLERSLVYGARPLDTQKYEEGLQHRKNLEAQLAHLEIACRDAGTDITLDGAPLFKAPGAANRFLLPGTHQVVATRPGFLTLSRTVAVTAGKLTSYTIKPILELTGHEVRPALDLEPTPPKPAAPPASPDKAPPTRSPSPPPAPAARPPTPPPAAGTSPKPGTADH